MERLNTLFSFSILIAISGILSCEQNNRSQKSDSNSYKIIGNLSELPDSTIIELLNKETEEVKRTYIIDGQFLFEGNVDEPSMFELNADTQIELEDNKYSFDFFVENAEINIEGSLANPQIEGSKTNDEWELFKKETKIDSEQFFSLLKKKDASIQDSLAFEKIRKEKYDLHIKYFKKNPDSYVTTNRLKWDSFFEQLTQNQIEEIYAGLSPRIKNSRKGKIIERYSTLPKMPVVGEKFIDFTLTTPEEKEISLSDIKAEIVLVDFWASWCGPCRVQNPELIKIYEEFKPLGLEVFGVSLDNNKDAWKKAIEIDGLPWINAAGEGGHSMYAAQLYRVNGIPDNLIIDSNGTILHRNLKGEKLENAIRILLQEKPRF